MAQVVARLPDALLGAVDALVGRGVVESRSDAVRLGLETLLDRHRRTEIGEAIAAGYRSRPQTESEMAWADDAARRMIAEEPW